MFEINIEFKKGILFIRILGELNKTNSNRIRKSVFPTMKKNGFKYVVINLDGVNYIDNYGIKLLNDINNIVMKFNGKTTLINNKKVESKIKGTLVEKILYKVKNEKIALGLFEL